MSLKITRSMDIVINAEAPTTIPKCPTWMVNSYARAKKLGLVKIQKKLEEAAEQQGCSLV